MRIFIIMIFTLLVASCGKATDTVQVPPPQIGKTSGSDVKGSGSKRAEPTPFESSKPVANFQRLSRIVDTKMIHANTVGEKGITLDYDNTKAKSVDIEIRFPTKNSANLRLSQIKFPDGKTDGPFGVKTQYNLKQNGKYTFTILPSQMADNAYTGAVDVVLYFYEKEFSEDVKILK